MQVVIPEMLPGRIRPRQLQLEWRSTIARRINNVRIAVLGDEPCKRHGDAAYERRIENCLGENERETKVIDPHIFSLHWQPSLAAKCLRA